MAMQLILYGCGGIGRNALNFFGKERVACFLRQSGWPDPGKIWYKSDFRG